ncbi:MAG: preprotein translocase subunit SecG [Candidatus Egerieousia sp.]
MYTILVILIVIASVFLTIAVLLQNSKGGGLAANFTAGNQTFGVRQTADFLEKATWTLAAVIILCCILATAAVSSRNVEQKSDLTKQLQKQAPVNSQPTFPIDAAQNAPETQEN